MGTGCVPAALRGRLLLYGATNVDHIVGDDAEAYPSLHSSEASVVGSAEAVPSLDHADASLGSSAPLLAIPEPSLSLLAFAFRTVRSSSEPRSNSPVTGSLATSLSRVRMARSRIIQ
jgi:hypothetical protein